MLTGSTAYRLNYDLGVTNRNATLTELGIAVRVLGIG